MKTSFATLGCPDWTLDHVLRNAHLLGYDGVELRIVADEPVNLDLTDSERAAIRQQFQGIGLRVCCLMGYTRFTSAEMIDDQVENAHELIQLAKSLDCRCVRIFGGVLAGASRDAAIDQFASALERIVPAAAAAGVVLALETHDDWCKASYLEPLLARVTSAGFGICWDIANSYFEEPLERTFAAIRERIVHVHVKDAVLQDGKHQGRLPGEGEVDLPTALALLSDIRYDGFLSFEWEKKWQPELAEPEIAFPRYLDYLRRLGYC